jgi:hypothetical protein
VHHPIKSFLLRRPRFRVLLDRAAGLAIFALVVLILTELFSPSDSQATLPVLDYAAVSQMLVQTEQFTQHLTMMAQQIAILKEQVQSLSGHSGIGNLSGPINGWGTSSWSDIVGMVSTGVNPGDAAQVQAYKSARAQVSNQYPPIDPTLAASSPRMQAVWSGTYQAAITGLSAGQGTFNAAAVPLADLQTYQNRIVHTDTVKAALDLNTAVGIKSAQINAELLRTNAMQLYLQANAQNAMASGQAAQSDFFAN